METVAQKTKRIIADTLGVDHHLLTYDTHLKNDLGADSMDILETIIILENEFGLTISDEKVASVKRVGDLVKYFEETKYFPLHTRHFQAA